MLNRRSLLLSAPASVVLAGTRPARAEAKTNLVVGIMAQDFGQLDPQKAVGTPDRIAVSWMFNGLVRFKDGTIDVAQIEPDLAERWETNEERTVWTFHLRRGVQFHAGFGEFTADDAKFSLDKAAKAETSAFSGDYRAFKQVTVVD